MANLTIPNTLAANTTITAGAHNINYSAISTWLNNRDNASDYWLNMKVSSTASNPAEIKSSATTCEFDIDCTGTNGIPLFTFRRSGTTYYSLGVDATNSNAFNFGTTGLTTNRAFSIPSTGQQVQFQPNSVGTPGISWIGDVTSGFYSLLSGSTNYSASGVKKLELTTQGIGITDGTGSLPGLYFFNDPDTGISRTGANQMLLQTNSTLGAYLQLQANGDIITSQIAPLATNATGGFFFLPTVAGTPTGTPTSYTGQAACLVDTTGSKLWVRVGASWKSTTLA